MRDFDKIAWRDFYLSDFFNFDKGNQNNMASLTTGNIPLVSARKVDNGLKDFVAPNNKKLFDGGIITLNVDGDGGAGIAYYQPYKMALDSHVAALIPKITLNKYQLIFIAVCITKQRDRFGHGYSINSDRIKSFKLMLPVTENGELPDWQFMNDFQRAKEEEILKPTIERLCKQMIINEISGGGKSLGSNWKVFFFTDVFTEIQRGKRLKKADHIDGSTPYVSSTSIKNGIDGFIGNESSVRIFDNCLTLANSGSVGFAFFHQYEFVASDHVTKLKRDGLDKYAYLFMIPLVSRLREKYSFNREIKDERIKREKLILPVNERGEIDFEFMSTFMQRVEQDILKTTLPIYEAKLKLV